MGHNYRLVRASGSDSGASTHTKLTYTGSSASSRIRSPQLARMTSVPEDDPLVFIDYGQESPPGANGHR